ASAPIQFPDNGHAKAIEWPLAVNRIEIEQSLGGMLASVPVPCIDHWNGRDLRSALRAALLVVADHDHVTVTSDDANGIFDLLALDLRRKRACVLGGEDASAKPVHGRLERESRSRRWLVKQAGHDLVVVIQRAPASGYALHSSRAVEQVHEQ